MFVNITNEKPGREVHFSEITWKGADLRFISQAGDGTFQTRSVYSIAKVRGKWPADRELFALADGRVPQRRASYLTGEVIKMGSVARITVYRPSLLEPATLADERASISTKLAAKRSSKPKVRPFSPQLCRPLRSKPNSIARASTAHA